MCHSPVVLPISYLARDRSQMPKFAPSMRASGEINWHQTAASAKEFFGRLARMVMDYQL